MSCFAVNYILENQQNLHQLIWSDSVNGVIKMKCHGIHI